MSLTLTALALKQSRLKGYKPRIGISVATMDEHFTPGDTFASDTQQFEGIIKSRPRGKYSADRLGGVARNGSLNWGVLNQELYSDIFNTYADPENNVVTGYLYWDVADVVVNSLHLVSADSSYLNLGTATAQHVDITSVPVNVGMWVKFDSAAIGANTILYESAAHSDYFGIKMYKDTSDKIVVMSGDGTGSGITDRRSRQGNTVLVADRWYYIAGYFSGVGGNFSTNAKIYINGVVEPSYTNTGSSSAFHQGVGKLASIGKGFGNPFYSNMYVAHFGFWTGAQLSAADHLSLYGDGTPKDLTVAASYDTDRTSNLLTYYDFSDRVLGADDSPTQVLDQEGGINATLTNDPLWSHQIPTCLDTDRIQFFKGTINNFPGINYRDVKFKAGSFSPFADKIVGDLIFDDDATSGYTLPQDSFGRMKPAVYGDHRTHKRSNSTDGLTAADWVASYKDNYTPMVHLGNDYWLVSGHALKTFDRTAGDKIYAWDSTLERMVELQFGDFTIIQNTSAGCIIQRTSNNYVDVLYPISCADDGGADTWTGPSNLADNDISTKATVQIIGSGGNADLDIRFPGVDYSKAGTLSDVRLVLRGEGDWGTANCKMFVEGDNTNLFSNASMMTYFDTHGSHLGASFSKVDLDVTTHAAGTYDLDLYACYLAVVYQSNKVSEEMPLYYGGRGKTYEAWINGRSTAETDPDGNNYTETHDDDDAGNADGVSGTVIENPAGVIEDIMLEFMGLANTQFDENSLNIISNDLSTGVLSFAISEQVNDVRKYFDDLLRLLKTVAFVNFDDKLEFKTFVSSDPFSASGDSVANNQDIYEFDPQSTFKIVTGENDELDLVGVDFGKHYVTIDAGEYTGATLAAEIQSKIDSEIGGGEITCTYDSDTGKFTFTEVGATEAYTINWSTGPDAATSIGRFIGFDISANDSLGIGGTLISDYPLWADSFVEHPIIDKSFSIKKTNDEIKTTVEVNYYKQEPTDKYQETPVTDTDVSFHAETKEKVVNHEFTRDQTTAEIALEFLSKNSDHSGRLSRKYWECKFKTWLNSIQIEVWDFINVRHPILNGLLGATELTQKWLVTDITYDFTRDEVEITAVEI